MSTVLFFGIVVINFNDQIISNWQMFFSKSVIIVISAILVIVDNVTNWRLLIIRCLYHINEYDY